MITRWLRVAMMVGGLWSAGPAHGAVEWVARPLIQRTLVRGAAVDSIVACHVEARADTFSGNRPNPTRAVVAISPRRYLDRQHSGRPRIVIQERIGEDEWREVVRGESRVSFDGVVWWRAIVTGVSGCYGLEVSQWEFD